MEVQSLNHLDDSEFSPVRILHLKVNHSKYLWTINRDSTENYIYLTKKLWRMMVLYTETLPNT